MCGFNGYMVMQGKSNNSEKGFKSIYLVGKKVDKIDAKEPVVNKVSFRDMLGVVTKFVRVGGDFV